MQTLYNNESSLALRWLMLVVGAVLLAVAVGDYFAIAPLFGINQHLDLTLLLIGTVLALAGLKEIAGFVAEITVDNARALTITRALGQAIVPGNTIRTLTIYASGKDRRRLTLSAAGGSYSFAAKTFAADRLAEAIKAINPAAAIEGRA